MSAIYYHDIYLLLVLLLTIIVCQRYGLQTLSNNQRSGTSLVLLSWLVCAFLVFFIGFRPLHSTFVDMWNYNEYYHLLLGMPFDFQWDTENVAFDNWFAFMASRNIPITYVFVLFAAVYFGVMLVACQKIFPKDTLLAFLVYLAAFSTFSYGTNGMKAGMAASIFLLALAFYKNKWISIPIAIFSYFMHHSMMLVIVAYFVVLVVKNPKYYFWIWLFCFLIGMFHITYFQHFFAGFTDEHGAGYLLNERSAFRLDFIIYSSIPVLIGYLMIYRNKIRSKYYNVILNLYLLTNSVWMLCIYSDFPNRIAYLSWFLYPIVILYPFVDQLWSKKQHVYLKYVVYGHLGFTLFMNYIYYVFLH